MAELSGAESELAKIQADYCYDLIKFVVNLFMLTLPIHLALLAALVAVETSDLLPGISNRILKILILVGTVLVVIYAWTTWYLVKRISLKFKKCLELLPNPMHEFDLASFDRGRNLFMLVGTAACLAGTALMVLLALFTIVL